MAVSKVQLSNAIERLKVDAKTPAEVIEYITNKLLNSNNENYDDEFIRFDTSNLDGLMDNVYFNTGNGLLIKRNYRTLCMNFEKITSRVFPLTLNELNDVIKLILNQDIMESVKTFKKYSRYGFRQSKDIVDAIRNGLLSGLAD